MQANNPKLAGFDWRGFAAAVEQKRRGDDLSVRALGQRIGLTGKDVSMAGGGHVIGVAKVHALLRWLDLPLDHFDIPPLPDDGKTTCYGRGHVKHLPDCRSVPELMEEAVNARRERGLGHDPI